MKKHLILILIIAITLTGCKKYEVQYGTETAVTRTINGDVYEVAYSTEDGVFLINAAMDREKMLVSFANKPFPKAGRVALSAKRDKVAYVDPDNGVPIIMDTLGNVLAQLTQYPNTKDLGWYNGDETLYILSNNQVHFHGRVLDLPSPLFVRPANSNNFEVTSLDISEDLDVAYGVVYYEVSSSGLYRDWYYAYNINYKSPSLMDESVATASNSHYYTQNISADSRRYYHTIRFYELEYHSYGGGSNSNRKEITTAYARQTQFNTEFREIYLLYKNNIQLGVDENGSLFREVIPSYSFEYMPATSSAYWSTNIPNYAPLYVDLQTDF